jgi:hypothetical protein
MKLSCLLILSLAQILLLENCQSNTKYGILLHGIGDTSRPDTVFATTARTLRSNRIPDSVFDMRNLRHLSIQGDDCDYGRIYDKNGHDITNCFAIKEIPATIGCLTKLKTIHLTVNAFVSLPKEMALLQNLQVCNLTDNVPLSDITPLASIAGLQELYVYGCRISRLPADLSNWKNLRELGLTGNPLPNEEVERIKKALPACRVVFRR